MQSPYTGRKSGRSMMATNELKTKLHQIMVSGDFNFHDIVWNADDATNHFLLLLHVKRDIFVRLSFYQLSDVKNSASNILDRLFVDDYTDVRLSEDISKIVEQSQQDMVHKPYCLRCIQ